MNIFISSYESDSQWEKCLREHLAILVRTGAVHNIWSRHSIVPGTAMTQEITTEIHQSQIVIMLISASYLASDQAVHEMRIIDHEKEHRSINVIPLIIADCHWRTILNNISVLPRKYPSLMAMSDSQVHEEMHYLVEHIEKLNRITSPLKYTDITVWAENGKLSPNIHCDFPVSFVLVDTSYMWKPRASVSTADAGIVITPRKLACSGSAANYKFECGRKTRQSFDIPDIGVSEIYWCCRRPRIDLRIHVHAGLITENVRYYTLGRDVTLFVDNKYADSIVTFFCGENDLTDALVVKFPSKKEKTLA